MAEFSQLTTEPVQYGLGQRGSSLTQEQIINSQKTFYACIAIYCAVTFFIKESICVQYYRIFPQKIIPVAVQVSDALHLHLVGLVDLRWIISMSSDSCGVGTMDPWRSMSGQLGAFVSYPIRPRDGRNCQNITLISTRFSNAAVNILTDIAVAVLPLPFLGQLQLNHKSKIALMIVFALGGA